ncbi:MAG: LysR family transcriptional regulator [Bacteriovoracaceae bacterium]|nr:LysR family transcriptional regulator [Bacteriovoracaceae bacterium]
MTLEQLLTIEAIVKEGSFKAAADYLHKSQPSISMAVKKLEDEYQITLFSRNEYRPSLSTDGKIFYQKAKILLREYRELVGLAKQMQMGVEPELRISIDAVSPVSVVLKFLRNFFEKHPDTRLELLFEVLSGTIERLLDGDVDIAITPRPIGDFPLDLRIMTKTKMVSVISTQLVKELVKEEKTITDSFLRNHNQIILADSARRIEKINSGILEGAKNLTVNDIGFKKELIINGLGWGGLPYDLIKSELAAKKLTVINTNKIKERNLEIYMVKLNTKNMGPVMTELWESLVEEE